MTQQVVEAWEKLYKEHKDTIIKTFRQVGLSLNPNGSEDSELSIRDLPNITVGDYTRQNPNDNVADIDDDNVPNTDNDSVANTDDDSAADTDNDFDSDSDFDEDIDGDEEDRDCNMD